MAAIGELWAREEQQTNDADLARYNSIPWILMKTLLSICMMTLVFLLYALHELPWRLYGSALGIIILVMAPFFAGLILGFTFESPKIALVYSVLIGFISIVLCMVLMMLPNLIGISDSGFSLDRNVWFYGFFIPFLITISFVPSGTMISSSANVYE